MYQFLCGRDLHCACRHRPGLLVVSFFVAQPLHSLAQPLHSLNVANRQSGAQMHAPGIASQQPVDQAISSSLVAEPARSRSRSPCGPVVTFRDQTAQADLDQDDLVQRLFHQDLSQEIADLDQRQLFDRELAADLRTCFSRTDSLDQELRDQRARTDFLEVQLTTNDSLLRALQSSSESRVEALQCSYNILWGKYYRLLDSLSKLVAAVDVITRWPQHTVGEDATTAWCMVQETIARLPYEDLPFFPRHQTYQYGNQDPASSTASSSTAGHRAASGSSERAASTASGSNIPQLHTILEEHRRLHTLLRHPTAFSKAPASTPPLSISRAPADRHSLIEAFQRNDITGLGVGLLRQATEPAPRSPISPLSERSESPVEVVNRYFNHQ